ncbi:MAG TPA: ubiquitin-activating E1 FCCH domain-containing protein, partial [Methanosarcinales archaeon]|nr:ubiquitin-activating E1 FCCH domain-containing protein [Methanosarcinales archaeon]
KFPNTILVYNYTNDTWAFFKDNVTAFGYHALETELTWTESIGNWADHNEPWNSGVLESKFRYVISGNQQGFTFLMSRDWARNAFSQQITDITSAAGVVTITSINHNLTSGDWVHIHNASGVTELNDLIYKVKNKTENTFELDLAPAITGTYAGNGTISLVSKIDIYTKRFNFYSSKGLSTNIGKTSFLVDNVKSGEITVDYLSSFSRLSLRQGGIDTGAILGTGILETTSIGGFEDVEDRFWHTVYLQAQGQTVQLRLYWNDNQMRNKDISLRWFEMHGIIFYTSPTQQL